MPIIPKDDENKEHPLHDRDERSEIIRPPDRDLFDISAELPGLDPTPGRRKPKNG